MPEVSEKTSFLEIHIKKIFFLIKGFVSVFYIYTIKIGAIQGLEVPGKPAFFATYAKTFFFNFAEFLLLLNQ